MLAVVEDHESARSDDLAQEIEVDEHVVEDVTAVDERRVSAKPVANKARQRKL